MKKFLMVGAAAVGLSFGFGGTARAGDGYSYGPPKEACCVHKEVCYVTKKITTYECVTVTECRRVPYEVCVTKYDNCGCPYTAHVTLYRTVEVKVVKHVPVVKYVQVPVVQY